MYHYLVLGRIDRAMSGPFQASKIMKNWWVFMQSMTLGFPHLSSQKPVLALKPHHSVSNEVASCTYGCRPLQCLFRPYSKPTLYLHLYLHLRLRNPYYAIKLTFNTSSNLTLCYLHKPTFRHRHNKLRHCLISINIPKWIPHRLCRLSPPLPTVSQSSLTASTGLYKTLLPLIFLLRYSVQNHMFSI